MNTKIFNNQLTSSLISATIPKNTNESVELIKQAAANLALSIFEPGKTDFKLNERYTIGSFFSQDKFGAGFTKALAGILAYQIVFEHPFDLYIPEDEKVYELARNVMAAADNICNRVSTGNKNLADARQILDKLDNFGGYYERQKLSAERIVDLRLTNKTFSYSLKIHPNSGHLVVDVPDDLSTKLLEIYRESIEEHLSESGIKNLAEPYNTGFIVVAYKNEIENLSPLKKDSALDQQAEISFKESYIVPVRGDNRYALIAAVIIESTQINNIRSELGLKELYYPERPLRLTYGAVRNEINPLSEEDITKIKKSVALEPWLELIQE